MEKIKIRTRKPIPVASVKLAAAPTGELKAREIIITPSAKRKQSQWPSIKDNVIHGDSTIEVAAAPINPLAQKLLSVFND